jgi:cytosine/adenosine deaminase-related metal-dependent hydrolase
VLRYEAAIAMVNGLGFDRALRSITLDAARMLKIEDRYGSIEPGKVADLTVFALDELHWDDDVFVHDLPGGSPRLRRPPGGYRYTLAAGEVTQEDGVLTDARPAGVLHSGTG